MVLENAAWRMLIVSSARSPSVPTRPRYMPKKRLPRIAECEVETVQARPHHVSWARLLKRVFDIDMQHCPNCRAGELKIIAAILRGEPGRQRS